MSNTAKLLANVPLPNEIEEVHDNAIVIDNGSSTIKAGFSGDDAPRVIVPTCTGSTREKIERNRQWFCCNQAYKGRQELELAWPIQKGIVQNWDNMERIWEHIYSGCLKISPSDAGTPVMLTEPALTPKEHREQMCQIFFEKLKVPSLYVGVAPVMSMYASGRTTGIVLECGNQTCHTVPIFEGFSLYHSICQLDFGGTHLTDYMQKLLQERNFTVPYAHRMEVMNFIKEKVCTVALDYKTASNTKQSATIRLPDGSELAFGGERFTCCEGLFNPAMIGVPGTTVCGQKEPPKGIAQAATDSIKRTDGDLMPQLYNAVILSGGTSMFPGLAERLQKDLTDVSNGEKVKIIAPTDRKRMSWIGSSILASLPTFQEFWVTKAEYEESGKGPEENGRKHVVHRNCF